MTSPGSCKDPKAIYPRSFLYRGDSGTCRSQEGLKGG